MPETPAVVSLHIWGVPTRHVPTAVTHMARHRRPVRAIPGVRFAKLLGTGNGRTFTPLDADAHHWGVLVCWADHEGPRRFADSTVARDWGRVADESATWVMRPLSSRGRWAKQQPFGNPIPNRWDGPIAAITRGRIKPRMWRTFWSSVPPVVLDVKQGGGLTFAMGIGEAPVGLQGTFSTWSDGPRPVCVRPPPPRAPTGDRPDPAARWYSEELFARFALLSAEGTIAGRPVPAPDVA